MNSFIVVPLSVIAWAFTLHRLRAIIRQGGLQAAGEIDRNILGMSLSFSISFTFIFEEFILFFDAHTFPSLSLLITNSAFLVSQHFGMVGLFSGMGIPTAQRIIRWMRLVLGVELITMLVIYIAFVSKTQAHSFFAPQSASEAIFIMLVSYFGILMCTVLVITQLIYFPAPKFILMRLRTTFMILCIAISGVFLFLRILTFGSYLWPALQSSLLIPLSYAALITTTLFFFAIFLSDRLYARFVVMSKVVESWRTFCDLKSLVDGLVVLCPVIGLPVENPAFWQFLFNPEYYLYRAIIIILDSRVMLSDFLVEATQPDAFPQWEDDLLQEAQRMNAMLQAANPSNDFSDIVETYRRVSQNVFASQI